MDEASPFAHLGPTDVGGASAPPPLRMVLTYRSGAVRIVGRVPVTDLRAEVLMQTQGGGFLRAGLIRVTPLAAFYREIERSDAQGS